MTVSVVSAARSGGTRFLSGSHKAAFVPPSELTEVLPRTFRCCFKMLTPPLLYY